MLVVAEGIGFVVYCFAVLYVEEQRAFVLVCKCACVYKREVEG